MTDRQLDERALDGLSGQSAPGLDATVLEIAKRDPVLAFELEARDAFGGVETEYAGQATFLERAVATAASGPPVPPEPPGATSSASAWGKAAALTATFAVAAAAVAALTLGSPQRPTANPNPAVPGHASHPRGDPAPRPGPQTQAAQTAPLPMPATATASAATEDRRAENQRPKTGRPATNRPAPTAEELFRRAKQARRDGRAKQAQRLFRRLRSTHPDSRYARTALVSLARLELDALNDPAAAVATFDSYLALGRHTPLHEEALVGKAEALRRNGRKAAEARAWEQLLRDHPGSPHASQARERIQSLAGTLP